MWQRCNHQPPCKHLCSPPYPSFASLSPDSALRSWRFGVAVPFLVSLLFTLYFLRLGIVGGQFRFVALLCRCGYKFLGPLSRCPSSSRLFSIGSPADCCGVPWVVFVWFMLNYRIVGTASIVFLKNAAELFKKSVAELKVDNPDV